MSPDNDQLIQEKLVSREESDDPEYRRTLDAYIDNPFFDLTKQRIQEYMAQKESAGS